VSAAGEGSLRAAVARAEAWITAIYRLELDLCAERFLVAPEVAQELLPAGSPRTGVVVVEDPDALSLGLYVHPEDRADAGTVIEETSHLVYLAWAAGRDWSVSQLVLELQAEVDRYVLGRLWGADPLLHFHRFRWDPRLQGAEQERYVTAHARGHRYCRQLERRYPERRDTPGLLAELRGFYRAGPERKLRVAAAA
jgi:hypothetical protein